MSEPAVAPSPPAHPRAGRNLPAAIATGVILVGLIVVTLAFPLLRWGFVVLVAAALALATIEIHNALTRVGMRSERIPIVVGTVAAVVVPPTARALQDAGHPLSVHPAGIVFTVIGFTMVVALGVRMRAGQDRFVRDSAASAFALGYVTLLGSFVTLMLAGESGAARVTAFILTCSASDTGGYVLGVLFGKHKMSPIVSPKKTWEGLGGSFLFACLIAIAFAVWVFHVGWWVGLIMGLVLTVTSVVGDLVESMIKRDVGLKDMSHFLPGHGGIMDRLDSLLVSAPFAWLCMFLMVPGG